MGVGRGVEYDLGSVARGAERMSANNVIYVQESEGKFFVWETDIDSPRSAHMGDVVEANSLQEAVKLAHRLALEFMYVEYGVQVLPEYKEKEE